MKLGIVLGCSMMLLSCFPKEYFDNIIVNNNSPNAIVAFLADANSSTHYPDTTLPLERRSLFVIEPNRSFAFSRQGKNSWSEEIDALPADTLSVYIIDAQIYKDSNWSTIRTNNIILKRYDIGLSGLSEKGVVNYP